MLHRDVSLGNILVTDKPLDDSYAGFIHDFDYSSLKDDMPEPEHQEDDLPRPEDDDMAAICALINAIQPPKEEPIQKERTVGDPLVPCGSTH